MQNLKVGIRITIFIIIGVLLIIQSIRTISDTITKSEVVSELEDDVKAKRLENLELLFELDSISSEEYTEREARDRLGYAKEGELIIIIPDEILSSPEVSGYYELITQGDQSEDEVDLLQEWRDLLVEGI